MFHTHIVLFALVGLSALGSILGLLAKERSRWLTLAVAATGILIVYTFIIPASGFTGWSFKLLFWLGLLLFVVLIFYGLVLKAREDFIDASRRQRETAAERQRLAEEGKIPADVVEERPKKASSMKRLWDKQLFNQGLLRVVRIAAFSLLAAVVIVFTIGLFANSFERQQAVLDTTYSSSQFSKDLEYEVVADVRKVGKDDHLELSYYFDGDNFKAVISKDDDDYPYLKKYVGRKVFMMAILGKNNEVLEINFNTIEPR